MKIPYNLSSGESKPVDVSHLSGFIGQESVIKKIKFFAESHSNDTPFPTLLFTGSHGLGKTYLSEKVAKVLRRNFVSINCGSIKNRSDFLDLLVSNDFTTMISLDGPPENHDAKRVFPDKKGTFETVWNNIIKIKR